MTRSHPVELGLGRPFDQVCVLVEDLEMGVEAYARILGVGPWVGWRYDGDYLAYRTFHGAPAEWSMRVAVTTETSPQLELVEPVRGPSIFDLVRNRGPGLHHVAYFVSEFDPVRRHFETSGWQLIQAGGGHGIDGDGRFGYFGLTDLGIVLEIIEPPSKRAAPHFRWP